MAQTVTINGVSYPDVPAVDLNKTGGGVARFCDTSDANAIAEDILSGKTAYVNGVKLTGTGSGSVEPYAVIVAHYHAGETCTCTQGSTVLTAPSGLTSFAFMLPSGGTWTVSATDGAITASRSVTITAQYQVEDVYLHEYYIVKDGRLRSGISVQTFAMKPYSSYATAAAAPTFVYAHDQLQITAYNAQRPRCGVAAFFPAVDLTGYTLLIATGEFYNTTGNDGTCRMNVYTEVPADGKFDNSIRAEYVSLSKNDRLSRIEIPIVESRGLTRNIGFFLASQGANNDGHAYITDLWLQ